MGMIELNLKHCVKLLPLRHKYTGIRPRVRDSFSHQSSYFKVKYGWLAFDIGYREICMTLIIETIEWCARVDGHWGLRGKVPAWYCSYPGIDIDDTKQFAVSTSFSLIPVI